MSAFWVFNDEATTQGRGLGRVTHASAIRVALAVTCGFSAAQV